MRNDPLKKGDLTVRATGIGTVTRQMVGERAAELAILNGHSVNGVTRADWEQAKRELTGGAEMDPREAALESVPESERWDPVPGSAGHKVPVSPGEDEDEEGRSDKERLVEEGIKNAGHDQMLRAASAEAELEEEGPQEPGQAR